MIKRSFSATFGIMLILCWAFGPRSALTKAESGMEWINYNLGEARQYQPGAAERPDSPPGLEAMYEWMEQSAEGAGIRILRMPAGRVLASVSLTEPGTELTAGELQALWPQIAKTLGKRAIFVDSASSCATTAIMDGREWLHIQTMAVLEGETMLSVSLEGYANCDTGRLTEIWLLQPGPSAYLYDDEANQALQQDRQAVQKWLESVSLP